MKILVLARLLTPNDFGVYGLVVIAVTVPNLLLDLGFDDALIQREDEDIDDFLDTVWSIRVLKGLLLAALIAGAARWLASSLSTPELAVALPVASFAVFAKNATNPGVIYFRKRMEFHRKFVFEIIGVVVGFGVAIALAITSGTYWALVVSFIVERSIRAVVSFGVHDYRPRPAIDGAAASELFEFGRWVQLNRVVGLTATKGDDVFVGWFLGATPLGFYQLAFKLANIAATEIAHVVADVMFPAFSKLSDDAGRLRNAFVQANTVTFALALPIAVGTVLVAPEFVQVLLGAKWAPMIPAIQVLAFSGLLRSVAASGGVLFKGVGEPEWEFRANSIRVTVIVVSIWPLTARFGIVGASASITAGLAAMLPIWFLKSRELAGLTVRDYLRIFVPSLAACLVMVPVVWVLKAPQILPLAGAILGGALAYLAALLPSFYFSGLYDDFAPYIRRFTRGFYSK